MGLIPKEWPNWCPVACLGSYWYLSILDGTIIRYNVTSRASIPFLTLEQFLLVRSYVVSTRTFAAQPLAKVLQRTLQTSLTPCLSRTPGPCQETAPCISIPTLWSLRPQLHRTAVQPGFHRPVPQLGNVPQHAAQVNVGPTSPISLIARISILGNLFPNAWK